LIDMPVLAYVFINVEAGRAFKVLEAVKKIEGVKDAHTVTGIYDIIALVEAADLKELGEKIVDRIQGTKGVERTVTAVIIE